MVLSKDIVSLPLRDYSSKEDSDISYDCQDDGMFPITGELFEDFNMLEEFDWAPGKYEMIAAETSNVSNDQQLHQDRSSIAFIATLSDESLEKMSIHDLNKHLRRLPKGLVNRVRRRRRLLKNRKYSLKFRQKGCEKKNSIAAENEAIELEINQTREHLRKMRKERDEYKQKYARLKRLVDCKRLTVNTSSG